MNFEAEIKPLLEAYESNETSLVNYCNQQLMKMYDLYLAAGFPEACSKTDYLILPGLYREANYDGIDWTTQNGDLRHLASILEVDCMFHNKGKSRKALTSNEFEKYIRFSFRALS